VYLRELSPASVWSPVARGVYQLATLVFAGLGELVQYISSRCIYAVAAVVFRVDRGQDLLPVYRQFPCFCLLS
jgi:hypothetical protein